MNKLPVYALVAVTLAAAQGAQAADNGVYLGVSAGSVESTVSADTAHQIPAKFKGKDAAYKVILGVRPLDWLGAEISYMDLGKPDSGLFASDSTGISGYAVGFASLGPVVDVFAKGGLVNWKSKITAGSAELKNPDGTDLAYGGGLIVHLLSLSVRAEYEHFEIDDGANLVSVGLTWTFL